MTAKGCRVRCMEVGMVLRLARVKARLSVTEVAERLGRSRNTISAWEKDASTLPVRRLLQLCELYEVSPLSVLEEGEWRPTGPA